MAADATARRVGGVLALAVLGALAIALWSARGAPRPLDAPTDPGAAPVTTRTAVVRVEGRDTAVAARSGAERTRIAPGAPTLSTTLRVRFIAAGSGQPIAGLGATVCGESDPWGTACDATTDGEGVAVWDDVPLDAVRLMPNGDAEPVRLERGVVNERTVELGRTLRVEGRVVDERGEPAAGAVVWSNRGTSRRLAATQQAVADVDGRFAFIAYEVGGWAYLFATRDGSVASRVVAREWRDDGRAAAVTLVVGGRAGHVAGSVFGPDGASLEGALVAVLGSDARPPGDPDPVADAMGIARHAPPPTVRSGADGRFVIRDVPPGRALLEVRRAGSAPQRERVEVRADATAEVVVRMAAGSVVRGTVRDANGQPRTGITVAVGDLMVSTDSRADGTFELRDLPSGGLTVDAVAQGGARVTGTLELVEGAVTEWNPVFPAGGRIAGTLRDARGAPVGPVAVWIDGIAASWSWTGADGGFEFAQIPDGTYELMAQLPDGTRALVATGVVPDVGPIEARLPELPTADATILGRVVDTDGAPMSDVLVRATHVDLHAAWQVRTGAGGAFQKAGVRPGRWQILIESGQHPSERLDALVAAGHAHDVGTIELTRRVPVEVRVTASPRPGGWLTATLWGGGFEGAPCLIRGGHVELPPLRPGSYRLDVAGRDYARTTVTMTLEEGVHPGGCAAAQCRRAPPEIRCAGVQRDGI